MWQTLGPAPDGLQGFGRVLLDSVLNMHGSVDLFVEDAIDMTHGAVHSYMLEMEDTSSSAYDGDMKVGGRLIAQSLIKENDEIIDEP